MTISDDPLLCGPHSAVDAPEAGAGGVNAGPRAQAREATPDSAQSGAQFTAQSAPTLSDIKGWFQSWATPPDIWSQDRPGLAKTWAYASRGAWARPAGPSRRLGQVYVAVVAFPVKAACQLIDWTIERPSRLAAAVLLLVVLAQFPPISWLI